MAIVLCFSGLNNKYPLLDGTSGAFINSTKTAYGFFIAHASWGVSAWLVIFTQAMALSTILYYVFNFFATPSSQITYILFIFFITFFTSASISVSSLFPGAFTGIAFLSSMLLLFCNKLPIRDLVIISVLFFVSIVMDLSHILSIFSVVAVFVTVNIITRKAKKRFFFSLDKKGLLIVGSTLLVTSLLSSMALPIHVSTVLQLSDLTWHVDTPNKLITQFKIPEYHRLTEETVTFQALYTHFNGEIREYLISRQGQGWLSLKYINYCNISIGIVSFFVSLIKIKGLRFQQFLFVVVLVQFLQFIFMTIFPGNTGYGLWQVIWLLPLPLFIYHQDIGLHIKNKVTHKA